MSLLMLFFRINFHRIQIINNNIPSKILCSASICQYVIPEVDGDSERGLCWSITRIRKWTKKNIGKQSSNKIFLYHKVSNSRPCIQCTYRLLWHNPQTSPLPQDRPRVLYERGVWLTHPVEDHYWYNFAFIRPLVLVNTKMNFTIFHVYYQPVLSKNIIYM